jgi:hypothetical protein
MGDKNAWEEIFAEEELVQVCQICRQPVMSNENPVVIVAYDRVSLGHNTCAQDALIKKDGAAITH